MTDDIESNYVFLEDAARNGERTGVIAHLLGNEYVEKFYDEFYHDPNGLRFINFSPFERKEVEDVFEEFHSQQVEYYFLRKLPLEEETEYQKGLRIEEIQDALDSVEEKLKEIEERERTITVEEAVQLREEEKLKRKLENYFPNPENSIIEVTKQFRDEKRGEQIAKRRAIENFVSLDEIPSEWKDWPRFSPVAACIWNRVMGDPRKFIRGFCKRYDAGEADMVVEEGISKGIPEITWVVDLLCSRFVEKSS